MAEFNVRSDAVDVEQIMAQIRSRIREKRGVDYTEEEIRELASVKLERFLDPKNVRSDLLEHYRQRGAAAAEADAKADAEADAKADAKAEADAPPFPGEFDPSTVYKSARPGIVGRLLHLSRRLLNPVLKLFFNPGPLLESVSVQSRNVRHVRRAVTVLQERTQERTQKLQEHTQKLLQERTEIDALTYEVMNNLVVEMTRLAIDLKNHKMRVESVAARLDFDERRSRALEETVQRQRTPAPPAASSEASGERKRRRRRRGRRQADNDSEAIATSQPAATAAPEPAPAEPPAEPDGKTGPDRDSFEPDQES